MPANWLDCGPYQRPFGAAKTAPGRVRAGAAAAPYFQRTAAFLIEAHDSMDPVLAVVFILGALMFYGMLFRSKLVPRWLSGWGSQPVKAVEDQIQPELELVPIIVAGLQGVLNDHLGEMRVLSGGELPEDVLRDLCDVL